MRSCPQDAVGWQPNHVTHAFGFKELVDLLIGEGRVRARIAPLHLYLVLAMPKTAEPWSLTSLRERLIKIGAKVVSHGRYATFQMAEVVVPRQKFRKSWR